MPKGFVERSQSGVALYFPPQSMTRLVCGSLRSGEINMECGGKRSATPLSKGRFAALVRVFHLRGVLPGVDDVIDDLIYAHAILHLGEHERPRAAHPLGVALHDLQVGTHGLG